MKLKILAKIGCEKSPQSQQMKNHPKVGYRADGEGWTGARARAEWGRGVG